MKKYLLAICLLMTTQVYAQNTLLDTTGKPISAQNKLTNMQKYVILHDGTEPPFQNEYWDNHEEGLYVDRVSGEPLFLSTDKYDSGTGWPSFTKAIKGSSLDQKTDQTLGMSRMEVRASKSNAHLGHVFEDGPKEKGGQRYCINSAALRFIPKDKLKEEGYKEFEKYFDKK